MIYVMDLVGVAVFAVTGAIAAGRKQMDGFGVVVLAVVTGIGGGTLRDVLLGVRPIFWVADQTYVLVAVAAGLLTMLTARLWISFEKGLAVADAFGLSLFAVIGTQHAMDAGAPGVVAVLMGVITGVAGGVIRDMLANEMPFVLRGELYATAAAAGSVLLLVFPKTGVGEVLGPALALVLCLAIRLAAIRWRIQLPIFRLMRRP